MLENQNNNKKEISRSKVILSQVIACLALDLLLVGLGTSISFVTIVLPEVLNAKEGLSINELQASWFGGMAFLCQPLGSVFSGPILDYFGRKRAFFIVNIPHIIAWVLVYYAWDTPSLFIANALLGIGTGIMEAPAVTYVGEVSDSSVRGILTTLAGACTSVGMFVTYFLGKMLPWRPAALICLCVPLITMVLVTLVPETPIWLLSKGRQKQALMSLCKLRGWASPENVKEEFDDLVQYSESMSHCIICIKTSTNDGIKVCDHATKSILKSIIFKIRYVLLAKETLRPFGLVMAYFFFHTLSGVAAIRPNMVNFCKALGMAYDPKTLVVIAGAVSIFMAIISAAVVKIIGKRKLIIGSMLATTLSSYAISIYSKYYLNEDVFSYEINTFPHGTNVVPVILFMLLMSFTCLGIPWVLVSEMFPFRSRGIAAGWTAAGVYILFFLSAKTNYDLEYILHMSGAFGVYATIGLLGTIYLYLFLPETENKTLLEIEEFYKGKFRIFADDPFINLFIKKKVVEQHQPMLVN